MNKNELIIINLASYPIDQAAIKRLFAAILSLLIKKKVKGVRKLKTKELTLVLVSQKRIRELNKQFRNKDYPTDILSFSGQGESLGELIISPFILKKQAKQNQHSFADEFSYIFIHGILHLLGYEHEDCKKQERVMMNIQDQVFVKLPIIKVLKKKASGKT